MLVLGRVVIERAPGAEVVPCKVHALHIHVVGLLHHGIVDRVGGTGGEIGLDEPFLGGSAEIGLTLVEECGEV